MTKYEKIARWIASQNVDRTPNDKDIKEIAEYMFGERLTSTGVKYVKEELANIDSENSRIRDSRPFHRTVTRLIKHPEQLDEYSQEELQDLLIDVINEREGVRQGVYANELDELYGLLDNKRNEALKDSKVCKDYMPTKTPLDYICEKLDAEGIEYEIEDDVYGENAPFDTYITILEGDDSRADDIICEVVGEAYEWVRDKNGNRRYCKVVTDPELIDEFNGTSVRDKKFKDGDICERLKKETNNFTKSFTGNIIVEGKDLMQAVRLLQKYYVDVDWKKLPPIKPSHPSGKQIPQYEIYGDTRKTIKDSLGTSKGYEMYLKRLERFKNDKEVLKEDLEFIKKTKSLPEDEKEDLINKYKFKLGKLTDSKTEEPDLEFIVEFNTHSPIHCDTVEDVEDYIKEGKKLGHKLVEIKIYAPNGSTSVNSLRELKEFIANYEEQMSLEDASLTHKQKLWYGGELEKFIHPQYLRRNYQLKRIAKPNRKRGR